MLGLLFYVFFPILGTQSVASAESYLLEFSEDTEDQDQAKVLFETVGESAKLESDYLWSVDAEGALLNPLVLVYRFEARRINERWSCYKNLGVDESMSSHAWTRGLLGNSFDIPPKYFCEGQLRIQKNGMEFYVSVNTSRLGGKSRELEAQVSQLASYQSMEYLLAAQEYIASYQISRVDDLECGRLMSLRKGKGREYTPEQLEIWSKSLMPSFAPPEYRIFKYFPVSYCKVTLSKD